MLKILQINSHFSMKGSCFSMDVEGLVDHHTIPIDEVTYNSLVHLIRSEPTKVEPAQEKKQDILDRLIQQAKEEIKRESTKKESERQLSPFEKVGFVDSDVVHFSADMVDDTPVEEDPGEQYHEAGDSDADVPQF